MSWFMAGLFLRCSSLTFVDCIIIMGDRLSFIAASLVQRWRGNEVRARSRSTVITVFRAGLSLRSVQDECEELQKSEKPEQWEKLQKWAKWCNSESFVFSMWKKNDEIPINWQAIRVMILLEEENIFMSKLLNPACKQCVFTFPMQGHMTVIHQKQGRFAVWILSFCSLPYLKRVTHLLDHTIKKHVPIVLQ